jgi:diguanylate cyclase (GGDEF)-like protein
MSHADNSDLPAIAGPDPDVARRCSPLQARLSQNETTDLTMLKHIVASLPAAVTVQDGDGRFLLANDAAAAQFQLPAGELVRVAPEAEAPTAALMARRDLGRELLRAGRSAVCDEAVAGAAGNRVFRTAHKPVRIAGIDLLLSSAIDVTDQKEIEQQLFDRAYFDELTGLPTRSVIETRTNGLLAGDDSFALAFLDLDNFKQINDYYGHTIGDGLLVEFTKRISLNLRSTDMLSRISGDEFLLLLNPVLSRSEVDDYIEFVVQRLRAPFYIDGTELFASASIGVSIFPEHGRTFSELRHNADVAMYQIKNATKGGAVIFDASMEQEAQQRMQTEQALRLAILDKRFCCAFQPKVEMRSQKVHGIEALVRLRDENGEIQAPGSFINLAVELGLIDELTHLVLAEIMQSIDLIDMTFGADVSISVNVAAKQACNLAFMSSFTAALEATGCPERFIVEVTEDAFVAKSKFQTEILPMLRRIGVRISIDDFGIGYSSLSALADITADEIKIDRSFITDIHKRPRSQSILRAIESISDALGMTVIAEGVETIEEVLYLQSATRIRYAQGYYYSKPVYLEDSQRLASVRDELRWAFHGRHPEPTRRTQVRSFGSQRR